MQQHFIFLGFVERVQIYQFMEQGKSEKFQCFDKVTHIIFDLDGTLLDTESIYEEIYSDLIAKYEKTIPTSLKSAYQGSPTETAIRTLIDELQLPVSFDELHAEFRVLATSRFSSIELMKGAEQLIRHFHSNNVPMAIATSSELDSAKLKMANFPEVFKLIHHVVTSGDILNGKPAPDIFLLAAKRFPDRPKPESCLVLEDSPNGVRGARAANMQCVMTPDKRLPMKQREEATLVLGSLEEFQPERFGLPPLTRNK